MRLSGLALSEILFISKFRPLCSQLNTQWILLSPLTEIRVEGCVGYNGLNYSAPSIFLLTQFMCNHFPVSYRHILPLIPGVRSKSAACTLLTLNSTVKFDREYGLQHWTVPNYSPDFNLREFSYIVLFNAASEAQSSNESYVKLHTCLPRYS
jgi:hypothetical protein